MTYANFIIFSAMKIALKCALNIFPTQAVMYRKHFVSLCRQTICHTYSVFNTVCAIPDINNIDQFQDT